MHAISSFRGNRPTNKQTHRQDRLQYTVPQLARNVKQEFVRPRWPYDTRPSARAEKYMCVIVIR